jgi:hypothetical protein
MKRIVESDESAGLEALLGEQVLLFCANYFYTGKLVGVNKSCVALENPAIVYETGAWDNKSYTDVQKMHVKKWYVQLDSIESFGLSK